ncbi:MAG: hypothetical protein A2Y61_05355 [Chloroflexi bacterium RBG_13_60_13]|nr:MAG: hypothetical protein A2Y61_05355 [Chloroflexi bacterium RBG_13_60_13]
MIVIGVDPGKAGAIVRLGGDYSPFIHMMPLISGARRDEYDAPLIVKMVEGAAHVFVEKLQPMPLKKGGTIANFNRGFCNGLFIGLLTALNVPFTMVRPQEWQKEMLSGVPGDDTKQRSILAAQRLFPSVSLLPTERCRKPSDGIADALLIAEFGRRRLGGS